MTDAKLDLYTVCPEESCGMVLLVDRLDRTVLCPKCRTEHKAHKLREPFQSQFDEGPMLKDISGHDRSNSYGGG